MIRFDTLAFIVAGSIWLLALVAIIRIAAQGRKLWRPLDGGSK